MPKGIPNEKAVAGQKTIVIKLNEADFLKLEKLAMEQYRTPALQAGYLIKQVLSQVATVNDTAEKIVARAHARTNGEA